MDKFEFFKATKPNLYNQIVEHKSKHHCGHKDQQDIFNFNNCNVVINNNKSDSIFSKHNSNNPFDSKKAGEKAWGSIDAMNWQPDAPGVSNNDMFMNLLSSCDDLDAEMLDMLSMIGSLI